MKLDQQTIEDVRQASSITQVIGNYIQLVKKGRNYTAVCPFHDDHHPSLSISESKQIYKCFVCGKGGNAFNFVMDFKKISFPESVKEVASISGMDIKIDVAPAKKVDPKLKEYYDALAKTIEYSNYLLTSSELGKEALDYLDKRGINKKIINDFNIGYNPGQNKMYSYLSSEKITDEQLNETNVCRLTDSGMKDVFSDRILFPIHDTYGNPVAFTARDFKGTSDSKYINTSETKIYTKGDIVYNYHRAREECRRNNAVIVVEGVLDVIAFNRVGINYVVATLGTACSDHQMKLIQSLNKNIIFAYDGDEPGRAANLKNGLKAFQNKNNVFVMNNDTGLDPDEIIAKFGNNKLRDLLSARYSYIQYAIDYYKSKLNLKNFSDKKELHTKISALLANVDDPDEKESYANQLFELTQISIKDLNKTDEISYQFKDDSTLKNNGIMKAQYNILAMMAMSKDACDEFNKIIGCLIDDDCSSLARLITLDYKNYGECSLSRILDFTEDLGVKNIITTLGASEDLVSEYNRDVFVDTINRVVRELKFAQIEKLKNDISQYDSEGNKEKVNELLAEFQKLAKELKSEE